MSRRHHHHLQPYDYDRFTDHSRDRDRGQDQARGIEYQDDSLSSINSDEESYLHHAHISKDKKQSFYSAPKSESNVNKVNKTEKPVVNNETYHSKEMKVQQPQYPAAQTADGTSERLARLETMLEELIKRNNPVEVPVKITPPVPEKGKNETRGQFSLEPRRHNFTTSMWINKIQEISIQNNWDEKTTISYMGTKMSGIIKAWYNNLPHYEYTWPEWKIRITKMFPDNTDFVTSLKRLVTRLKQADETMNTYYFCKMYLIECCKITGEDAVSCLIDGLNNQSIQEQAKAQNFLTPETLYSQFLTVLPEYTVDYAPAAVQVSDPVLSNWYYQDQEPNIQSAEASLIPEEQIFEYEKPPMNEEFDFRPPPGQEFNDDEPHHSVKSQPNKRQMPVHARLDKRFIKPKNFRNQNKIPLAAKVCTICFNRGHLARNCRSNKINKVMCLKLNGKKQSSYLFKECTIKGLKLDSFIDTGCTTVTITEEVARKLNLELDTGTQFLEVFGGRRIRAKGETQFVIQVDSVSAQVRAVVVPNYMQDVPVIIGQEYLNQKNVCAVLQNGTLNIFEAPNKLTN